MYGAFRPVRADEAADQDGCGLLNPWLAKKNQYSAGHILQGSKRTKLSAPNLILTRLTDPVSFASAAWGCSSAGRAHDWQS